MQVLNLLIAALGSAMAVILLVVALIYRVHLGDYPELASQLPMILWLVLPFALIGAVGWLAAWARARRPRWRWLAEAAMVSATVGGGLIAANMLQT